MYESGSRDLDGLVEVAEEGVEPEQAHQREVAQHLVQGVPAKVSSNLAKTFFIELLQVPRYGT